MTLRQAASLLCLEDCRRDVIHALLIIPELEMEQIMAVNNSEDYVVIKKEIRKLNENMYVCI